MADLPMQLTQDLVSKSIITPSMLETQRMVYLKQDFENSLGWDFKQPTSRQQLIKLARVLNKEMEYALTAKETADQNGILEELWRLQNITTEKEQRYASMSTSRGGMQVVSTSPAEYKTEIKDFEDAAFDFLGIWNAAGVNHGLLGSKTKRQISEFRKVYSALESANIWYNDFGLPVSSETLFYASHLVMRTYAKWDNLIFFEGKPGVGKDTTADSIFTTMATLSSDHQYNIEHIFFREGRKIVEDQIRSAPPFTIFKMAEAGNQFGSKKFWDKEQIDLTDVVNWIRNAGLTLGLCWKEALSLDSSLRKNRAISTISIKHRGTATVKTFNENPYATEAVYTPKYLKKKVVINTQKASLMQLSDPTTLMQLPIYSIDETDWWQKEETKKNQGRRPEEIRQQNQGKASTDRIVVFLRTMRGARIIERSIVEQFNLKNATNITLAQLTEYMADNSGIDKKAFISASGYILLPPAAQAWLDKV